MVDYFTIKHSIYVLFVIRVAKNTQVSRWLHDIIIFPRNVVQYFARVMMLLNAMIDRLKKRFIISQWNIYTKILLRRQVILYINREWSLVLANPSIHRRM